MLRLAALLLICLANPATAAAQDDVDPLVAMVVANVQERGGWEAPGLMRFTGARGEGRTLILEIELAPEAPELLQPSHVVSMTATGLCSVAGAADFFSEGRLLRVQVSRAGRAVESVTVDRCPGPAGEGLTAAAFAGGLQTFVGLQQGDMTIAAIRAEGNTMIVTLAFPAGADGNAAANSEGFVTGFCGRPEVGPAFFGNRLILRVDTRIGERVPVPGPPVTACPAQ